MLCKLGFLVLAGAIVSVVVSTNVRVVRKLNPDTNFPPFADSLSNRQCSSSTCPNRSACSGGRCCMCKCLYDWPNVLVNGASTRCLNYDEIHRESSANCQYGFRKPSEPLEVIPLTEEATGKIKFKNDSARVNCSENGLSVEKWQFLDVNARWQDGEGDVFTVDFRTVGGRDGNKKDLTFLNWNARLNSKYAGLLIRLSLMCGSMKAGCILAKINGTHTYDSPQSTTSAPASTSTSQQSSTDTPSTPVSQETTTSSPTSEPGSTEAPTAGTTSVSAPGTDPAPGPTTGHTTGHTAGHTAGTSANSNAPTGSADQQRLQATFASESVSTTPFGPIVGLIGGVLALICLVCLVVVLYRRRKKRSSEKPAPKDPEAESETKLEDYQDPVYAELPDNTAGDFDNPVYCDPSEEQFKRRSKQDPLPALPGNESTYQPLVQNTRTVSVSSPQEESSDYLIPDSKEPDTVEYDNPPASSQVPLKNEPSDYDNPPVGSTPPTNTDSRFENQNNESSDYDNPPVQGNSINPLTNTPPDYDNPPVLDIPQGVPADSTDDAATEPEYFVLESEDSSL